MTENMQAYADKARRAVIARCCLKFDNENPSDYSLLDVLKNALGAKVLTSIIPFSRVIKNSISYRMTAAEYMEYMVAAEKYNDLTKEIVELCD